MKTYLSWHGEIICDFKEYVIAGNIAKKIQRREIPEGRQDCYPNILSHEILEALENLLGRKLRECEIFSPTKAYPPHTDSGDASFMMPLEPKCSIRTSGGVHELKLFNVYSFYDGEPHATEGTILMFKII
jgi:hypothetical protein